MSDLNDYIMRYLPKPDPFFHAEEMPEYPVVDWDAVPFSTPERMMRPEFPRVLPPEHAREPMAHDGGRGVKDHSRLKHLLREWL
jgi:hypothetical protein